MSRYTNPQTQNIYVPGLGAFTRTVKNTGEAEVKAVTITDKNVGNVFNSNGGYLMRETGLSRVIDKNDKIITALADPGKYLASKNQRIIDMETELNTTYSKEFSRALVLGYSDEDAKARSLKFVNHLKEALLSDIDKDFPMEAIDLAKKKLLKKN